jgi:SAM-dependent methyltransferase
VALRDHYCSPDAWARGADPAYEVLSEAIVAASPVPLAGRLIADLGSGTGATGRAISAVGGQPISVDLSFAMLAYGRAGRPPAISADIAALPLGAASVGGAAAAFSLSHVEDPGAVLSEAARVTTPGGPVLAGVFAETGARHPAATVVDQLARQRGWAPPAWYQHMKVDLEPRVADPAALSRLAEAAGLVDLAVIDRDVDAGLDTPASQVAWRFGNAAMADFLAGLTAAEHTALVDDAVAALGPRPQPLLLKVRILSSVVPATR